MKAMSHLGTLLAGCALATGLILACSDDSPQNVDAAVCDCPAAEPPLTGRIISVTDDTAIDPGGGGAAGAACPVGATLLGGGCRQMGLADRLVVLLDGGPLRLTPQEATFQCIWASTSGTARTGIAEAICLMPAPAQ